VDGPHLLRKCRTHPFDRGSSHALNKSMPFLFGLSSPNILVDLRIRSSDSYFFHADFCWLLKSSTKRSFECQVENSVLRTAIQCSSIPLSCRFGRGWSMSAANCAQRWLVPYCRGRQFDSGPSHSWFNLIFLFFLPSHLIKIQKGVSKVRHLFCSCARCIVQINNCFDQPGLLSALNV
jgi:hypothetical protein